MDYPVKTFNRYMNEAVDGEKSNITFLRRIRRDLFNTKIVLFLRKSFLYTKGENNMNANVVNLEIDDYLDLYLLAGQMGDKSWQDDILETLTHYEKNKSIEDPVLIIHNLWLEHRKINTELLDLYRLLRQDPDNDVLLQKVAVLKKQKVDVCRKLYSGEKKTRHYIL